ncbi:hypothetical protein [Variovorax sp. LT1R16]|uniref:hypothetical protein n=1 Tax=Variovorax sp. LT1R16 TaxID=3443728 RepID=UPI003F467853
MTALLVELKTRARLRLNSARREQTDLRLRDCLHQVAREVGFAHWDQGRSVLGREAQVGDDMGRLWHAPACNALLNQWFANYDEACSALAAHQGAVLLPYQRQFIVAGDPFIQALGLDPRDGAWAATGHDLVRAYGTDPWLRLALQRLKAPPSTFARRGSGATARTGRRAKPST